MKSCVFSERRERPVAAVIIADAFPGSGSRGGAPSASVVVVVETVVAVASGARAVAGLGGRSNGGGLRSNRRAVD